MAFHDLTEDRSAPPKAKFFMGLGEKFICVPEKTKEENIFTAITRFERDFLIKVIFAPGPESDMPALSSEDTDKPTNFYVKSNWTPGYGDVPFLYKSAPLLLETQRHLQSPPISTEANG
jgi:hypothetical protein